MHIGDPRFEPIDEDFVPLTDEDLSAIEAAVEAELPVDYSRFLRSFGGCGFAGEASVIRPEEGPLPIFTFFGAGIESRGILGVLRLHPDLAQDHKLPIADDMAGNLYILDPATSRVYFVDFAGGVARASQVAPSFTSFLEMISVTPDD